MKNSSNIFFLVALLGSLGVAPAIAQSDYPQSPIRFLVPYSAGGLADTFARGFTNELAKGFGQPVIILNRPGGNTVVGGAVCANSMPNGYTLCLLPIDAMSYAPYLNKKLPYDPATSFDPITLLYIITETIVVNPSLKVNSLAELVALSKSKAEGLDYAAPASSQFLFMERFKKDTGARLTFIPYKSGGESALAVVKGEAPVGMFGIGNIVGYAQSGAVKPLAVNSPKRSPMLPDVPTLQESGYQVLNGSWFGLFVPAGTPKPIIARIHEEVTRVVNNPEVQAKYYLGLALEPDLQTPADFAAFLLKDRAAAEGIVRASNLQPE